ncbi:MAG TPA: FkbM family methyltransferase [Thermoplasmata archaeon]|nr:FkbM family methyltransferase [Thermoplasmata archaeon]
MTTDTGALVAANTTRGERWLARALGPARTVAATTKYRRAYRNWFTVLRAVQRPGGLPVDAILHTGQRVSLESEEACFAYALSLGLPSAVDRPEIVGFQAGELTLRYRNSEVGATVRVRGLLGNGDPGVFFDPIYTNLPVGGAVVVDGGANIGDSAIEFALRGAARVLALEPLTENFATACDNVRRNRLESTIRVERIALGPTSGTIRVDRAGGTRTRVGAGRREGEETPMLALEELVAKEGLEDAVLKLDCEGAEYEILAGCSDPSLRKFRHALVEYHYGHRALSRKFASAGFRVTLLPGRIPAWKPRTGGYVGYLRADRR